MTGLRELVQRLLGADRQETPQPTAVTAPGESVGAEALPTGIAVRMSRELMETMLAHVRDTTVREQAGLLFVRGHPATEPGCLVADGYMPVADEFVRSDDNGHGLSFDGRFFLRGAELADHTRRGMLLVHSHGGRGEPGPSTTDRDRGDAFLAFAGRRLPAETHGTVIVSDDAVHGEVVLPGGARRRLGRLAGTGPGCQILRGGSPALPVDTPPDDRQLLAVGAHGMAALSESVIAVIGLSGGGSHVVQQLLHAGAGTIIVIDPELVDETNLRRLVLATRADVNLTPKVDLAWRAAQAIRPTTRVVRVRDRFPSTSSLTVLRHADLIVGCLDSWDSRDDLNTFAVTHAIPYIDIGATITAGTGSRPTRLHGQVVVVEPGGPCLRCVGLVTDDRVRASQEAHLGYRDGEADAQVVSLNGTLASEAVTAAMMLLAGAPVRPRRRYRFPDGELSVVAADRDPGCPACALGPSPYP